MNDPNEYSSRSTDIGKAFDDELGRVEEGEGEVGRGSSEIDGFLRANTGKTTTQQIKHSLSLSPSIFSYRAVYGVMNIESYSKIERKVRCTTTEEGLL